MRGWRLDWQRTWRGALFALAAAALGAGLSAADAGTASADKAAPAWVKAFPVAKSGVALDPAIEARVDKLLKELTLEEKVGQVIQADISSVTPDDVRRYRLGAILAGGNSAPDNDVHSSPQAWLDLADAFSDAMRDVPDGRPYIPLIFGVDAVHGHSKMVGATIFPHNVGLGAARDPELIRRIGEVTALEMSATGIDWTFAPTVAVVRDGRWGRSYESYSEDPRVVASYARQVVLGLQGVPGTDGFLGPGKVVSTAKHYMGDGGTFEGVDQGDNRSTPEEMAHIHGAGYPPAVEAGVRAVMASYNSWNGKKMHGLKAMLTDVLRGRYHFNGFVVGDWNGHGQVKGCMPTDCPKSFNAGLDMFMAPDSWKGLYENTLREVNSGAISAKRLDEAVRRILRVKVEAGLFEKPRPSERPYAGEFELLGNADHRAVARQAVRESLVLLKNNGGLLPLSPQAHILVAGDGADNMGKQTGGWTLSWQGDGNSREDFPNGETIFEGIAAAVDGRGSASLSVSGDYDEKPDVAVVVFGEDPYAEFRGDLKTLAYKPDDRSDLDLLERLKADGIPVVAVFVSGRPLWVNPEINASDAFVAAWLPGSEGGGIADVLIGKADGTPRHDFKGTLSFSWPKTAKGVTLNVGDENYDPLFAFGYGLTYADKGDLGALSEDPGLALSGGRDDVYYAEGGVPQPWSLWLAQDGENTRVSESRKGTSVGGALTLSTTDRDIQEDSITASWNGTGEAALVVAGPAIDLSRAANGDVTLQIDYRLEAELKGMAVLGVNCMEGCYGGADITDLLKAAPVGEWGTVKVKLSCFERAGADMTRVSMPFILSSRGPMRMSISRIAQGNVLGAETCPPPVRAME